MIFLIQNRHAIIFQLTIMSKTKPIMIIFKKKKIDLEKFENCENKKNEKYTIQSNKINLLTLFLLKHFLNFAAEIFFYRYFIYGQQYIIICIELENFWLWKKNYRKVLSMFIARVRSDSTIVLTRIYLWSCYHEVSILVLGATSIVSCLIGERKLVQRATLVEKGLSEKSYKSENRVIL